jgi:hypothetical protein
MMIEFRNLRNPKKIGPLFYNNMKKFGITEFLYTKVKFFFGIFNSRFRLDRVNIPNTLYTTRTKVTELKIHDYLLN